MAINTAVIYFILQAPFLDVMLKVGWCVCLCFAVLHLNMYMYVSVCSCGV